ncbi:hypothetical protein ACHAPJ_009999 [Fusarium lateritium]
MASSLSGLDSLQCEFVVPDASTLQPISRWSDTQIDRPALIVSPKTEQDIQTAISIAKDNKLTVVVAGGGHGTFVKVGSSTLYLDLKHFQTIDLNKEKGTVRVGGAALCGDVLKRLTAEGYYTPIPNSNAVGFVGCVLGGGNTPLVGLHGWMSDIVLSFRLITSEGNILNIDSSSDGKELDLFNALCGAGQGLGVITEITTSAYPISDLNMEEDKIWTRSLIFPASAIEVAAQTFLDLSGPSPEGSIGMVYMRSPPGTPAAGALIIAISYMYFGPAQKAEEEAALLFKDDIVGKAVMAKSELLPFANMNYKSDAHNYHGGHKAICSCRLTKMDVRAMKTGFDKWVVGTEEHPDAQKTILATSAFNTKKSEEVGGSKFVDSRDRSLHVFIAAICDKEDTMTSFRGVMDDTLAEYRKSDEGVVPRSFTNNLSFETDLHEMFDEEKLEEVREVKRIWDAEGVFWSPYSKSG